MAFTAHLLLLILLFLSVESKTETVTISTKLGHVKGLKEKTPSGTIYSFRGIPYAVAPYGELRFLPSQLNKDRLSENGSTFDATSFGASCIQSNVSLQQNHRISEDCLFLNIWTPSIPSSIESTDSSKSGLPVMIWIHGGGDRYGAGSDDLFHGNHCGLNKKCIPFVSSAGGVMLITLNYRLGALGFLSNKELFEEYMTYGGLNGIGDQITAIQWIYKNIADFGGNPDDLTIFGESAGGAAVCLLMISPLLKEQEFTIKNAMIQSGACNGPWSPAPTFEGTAFSEEQLVRGGYPMIMERLRKKIVNVTDFVFSVGSLLPTIDGRILTNDTETVYSASSLDQVINVENVVIGFNSMDGISGWPYYTANGSTPITDAQFQKKLRRFFPDPLHSEKMYSHYYPPSDFTPYHQHTNASIAWYTMVGDACLICPSLHLGKEILRNTKNVSVFMYDFGGTAPPFYASHAAELPFVFDYFDKETNDLYEVPWNQTLSNSMVSAWNSFGRSGIPDIDNKEDKINVKWPEFGEEENVMILNGQRMGIQSKFMQQYRNGVCDYWYNVIGAEHMKIVCYA